MARNPLIRPRPKRNKITTQLHKSSGILDDHAVRKNVATKEGTIEQVPTDDNHIVNKKYVDDENAAQTLQTVTDSGNTTTNTIAGGTSSADTLTLKGSTANDGNILLNPDGGNVGVNTDGPSYPFSIGSTDGTDQIGIYHDNSNAYMKWTDGGLTFQTDEGTNTSTNITIRGKGTGRGLFYVYNQNDDGAIYFQPSSTSGLIGGNGTISSLDLQNDGTIPVRFYRNSPEGTTQECKIYGYRTGDALRSLEIGVGKDAADTASFDGVSNYLFDGKLKSDTAEIGDGTNYTEIKSDGEIELHGTARVEKCVTIRVGGFKAPVANPADLEDLGIAQCYAFDPNVQQYISTEITLPVDMDRSVAPTLVADWSAAATTGTAVWQLEYLYRAADEDMTAAAQETLRGESTPSGTANGLVREEMSGIDVPSSTDKVMLVRISRDTTDGTYTDDMAGDAHLTAIKFCYTSNKLGEAT